MSTNAAREAPNCPPERRRAGRQPSWIAIALVALLAVPLIAALVTFHRSPWCPILDLAQTELRVRDVGTAHTPLIGLPGRIGTLKVQGSHPGPLSFYLLAPVYRLLGASSWAMQAGSVAIQIGAVAAALFIARRRAGTMLVIAVGAVLAVLMTGYGFSTLTEPWNPYLPVLWWVVFLLAVWSVACGDLPLLLIVVAAGSLCAQTHVPYLPLTVAFGALAAATALAHWWTVRRDPRRRRWVSRWSLGAAALGVLLWLPPTIDQLVHDPGNFRILIDHFTHPESQVLGVPLALKLVFERLDLVHLVVDQFQRPGTLVGVWTGHAATDVRGLVLVLLWLLSAAGALVLRHRVLIRLHVVVGIALLLAVYTLSRVFGFIWYYLMLWVWGIAVLMAIAAGWTAAVAVVRMLAPDRSRRAAAAVGTVLLLLTSAFAVRLTVAATHAVHASPLGDVLPPVFDQAARALDARVGAASGHDGRYLVLWFDPMHMGAQGFALLNELERRGFHVGVPEWFSTIVGAHRVLPTNDASAVIALATGAFVDRWREVPGAVEVAFLDSRSPEERREYEALREAVKADLQAAGLPLLVYDVDKNLFSVAVDPRLPPASGPRLTRMFEIGVATAVFVVPPGVPWPSL